MVATARKTTRKNEIKLGTTFSYAHADSTSIFTVVEKRGDNTYQCEIKAHPEHGTQIDWLGTKKVFGGEEITRAIATSKLWDDFAKSADDFWRSCKVGEIVHYHNGFGQYVRGEIVRVDGENKMKPIALVGNWTHDLPKRRIDGTVGYSYHVKKIRFPDSDSPMRPSDSTMWESKNFSKPFGPNRNFDPTTAPALDLSDPAPLVGDAAEFARYEKLRMKLTGILGDGYADPKAALLTAHRMIGELLAGDL